MSRVSPVQKIGEGMYAVTLNGELSLHGVTPSQPISARVTMKGERCGLPEIFPVRQSDYEIRPVSAAGGTVKLKDELKLSFDIAARKSLKAVVGPWPLVVGQSRALGLRQTKRRTDRLLTNDQRPRANDQPGGCRMCLAIPGKIVEISCDNAESALVDVVGVRRRIDLGLLQDDRPVPGDWVLIHVGFAMSKISEQRCSRPDEYAAGAGRD